MKDRQESAQTLALRALGWLMAGDDRAGAFLSATGLAAADLRALAADPALLGAVLDHLLADEALLLRFCADCEVAPEAPLRARADLPGGEVPHWT